MTIAASEILISNKLIPGLPHGAFQKSLSWEHPVYLQTSVNS